MGPVQTIWPQPQKIESNHVVVRPVVRYGRAGSLSNCPEVLSSDFDGLGSFFVLEIIINVILA